MRSIAAALAAFFLAASAFGQATSKAPASGIKFDKQKLAAYLSYAEGFAPSVKVTIDDPQPTALPGYYKVVVHLTAGDAKEQKVYHLTADGKYLVGDPVWELTESPFLETAALIPTDGPSFGPPDAKVTMVVFSDFQCPYCRKFAGTVRDQMRKKYGQRVRVIFKDFPLSSIHPWAQAAAEASHCVGDANADLFWAFHDWIFEHQGEIQGANLREKVLAFAKEHGLQEQAVGACIDTHAKAAEVARSTEQGKALGIEQTPTFFLNGRAVPGALPWESLDTLIQMELNRPNFIPSAVPGK